MGLLGLFMKKTTIKNSHSSCKNSHISRKMAEFQVKKSHISFTKIAKLQVKRAKL